MPLKLAANNTLDHSRCSHTQEEDEELIEDPLETVLTYTKYSCVHTVKGAKWQDHQDELQAFLLECKEKGSVADMRRLEIFQPPPAPKSDPEQVPSLIMDEIHAAFSDPYQGHGDDVLLAIMDHYHDSERTGLAAPTATKPRNYSLAVLQSSGTGKSRTVDMAAQKRFAFLLNLRGDGSVRHFAYPPPDVAVRDYFAQLRLASYSDDDVQSRLGAFFAALFSEAADAVKELPSAGEDLALAKRWHSWMQEGSSAIQVGPRRAAFYEAVVKRARSLAASPDFSATSVASACRALLDALAAARPERARAPSAEFFIAIDEAHVLTPRAANSAATRSVYQNLGTVLSWLNTHPVFTVFLSTNPRLHEWAAPADSRLGAKLLPPITELPFDTFATGIYSEHSPASLDSVCDIGVIAKFGRPLWHSLYKSAYNTRDAIIALAKDKLSGPSPTSDLSPNAQLACLSVRLALDLDLAREAGRAAASDLVASHMRVAFAFPAHEHFMRTGTPSEPLLAEAAARMLNTDRSGATRLQIDTLGPAALADAFRRGRLARGERARAEAVNRLLWTVAHDRAIESTYGMRRSERHLRFHRPVSVLAFLKSLFHADHHAAILGAKPAGDPNGASLEEAFEDAHLNFTHFALAADGEVLQVSQIFQLLLRGAALQCRDDEASVDHAAPILFGDPATTAIRADAASVLQGHTQNRKNPPRDGPPLAPPAARPAHDLPVLSLHHELGASRSGVRCVASKGSYGPCADAQRRHYRIVAYGAGSATYAAIPPSTNGVYASLLAPADVVDDFARAGLPGSVEMLDRMIPALRYAENGFAWF